MLIGSVFKRKAPASVQRGSSINPPRSSTKLSTVEYDSSLITGLTSTSPACQADCCSDSSIFLSRRVVGQSATV